MAGDRKFETKNGWVVYDLPSDAPVLTNEMLEEWETDEYDEEFR